MHDVKIIQLEPFRAASFYGFGTNPEEQAFSALYAWAGPRGYLADPQQHRIFGFNNPNPSTLSPNYGYEVWMTVGPEEEPQEGMRIIEFPGGVYALRRIENITDPGAQLPEAWKQLYLWIEDSAYRFGSQQWLEEDHRRPGLTPGDRWDMDLYLPVITPAAG